MFNRVLAVTAICLIILSGIGLAGVKGARDQGFGIDFLSTTVQDGPHPRIVGWTNSVVYDPGGATPQNVEFRVILDPNGNTAARTYFLFLRNNETGVVRYIDNTGLLDTGVVRAIDGSGPDNFSAIDVTALDSAVLLGDGALVAGGIPVSTLVTGHYSLVFELRELSGQRSIAAAQFQFAVVDEVVEVLGTDGAGNIEADTTWTSNNAYLINDRAIFVRTGATLTIEPGTFVLGTGQNSALVVARDGQLLAEGTAARPIVMTSADAVGERARSQWGGLILNGNAPINTGEQDGEGGTGLFGGDDPTDSSGSLKYVRVEFAGIEFSPDNELNGIAFQGTGSGTEVDFVQVHFNKDDGIEFFGGTTNVKHALLVGIGDDNLDWVLGWQGKGQFICSIQSGDDADQGIEADNLSANNDATPISSPWIYNASFIGDPLTDRGAESDIGVLLREGTAGNLRNFIVQGFKESAVDVDDLSTVNRINADQLTFSHSLFYGNCVAASDSTGCTGSEGANQFSTEQDTVVNEKEDLGNFTTAAWMTGEATNRTMDPLLRDVELFWAPDFRPALNSPALDQRFIENPPDDGFFTTPVNFSGCAGPTDDWFKGWSYFGPF